MAFQCGESSGFQKNRGANVKYASDPFWGEKAASFSYEIDKYLSGGNSNLKDTNSNQIGMATSNNKVIKKDGTREEWQDSKIVNAFSLSNLAPI